MEDFFTFVNQARQGDLGLSRIKALPKGLKEMQAGPEGFVVGHSETGHPHTVWGERARVLENPHDPFTCYLVVDGDYADLIHRKPLNDPHRHKTIRVPKGIFELRRQGEDSPQGWRPVQD